MAGWSEERLLQEVPEQRRIFYRVLAAVSAEHGMSVAEILASTVSARLRAANAAVIFRLAREHGWSQQRIARGMGRSQATVFAALKAYPSAPPKPVTDAAPVVQAVPYRDGSIWTAELDERVRRGLAEGESRSVIAAALSRMTGMQVTRNAVIGRCGRLGLRDAGPRRGPAVRAVAKEPRRGLAAPAPAPKPARPKVASPPVDFRRRPEPGKAIAAKVVPSVAQPIVCDPIGLFDAGRGRCKAPLWGHEKPALDQMMVCGAPVDSGTSWCGGHRAAFFSRLVGRAA